MNAEIRDELRRRVDQQVRAERMRAGETRVIDASDPDVQQMLARLCGAVCLDSPIDLAAHVRLVASTVLTAKALNAPSIRQGSHA